MELNEQAIIKPATVTDAELTMHLENLGLIKDLTSGEKNSYLQIAKAFNLNPFKREIHVSKYNGQMSIIVGYETYIKRAERSGLLDGWEVKTSGNGEALKATITIYRKDRKMPFVWEVAYKEYVQKTKEGAVTKFWQKAETMTKKVAMAQGFRLCFSDELGGMPYTKEEINDIEHEVIPEPEVKQADTPAYQPALKELPKIKTDALKKALERLRTGKEIDLTPSSLPLYDKLLETFSFTPEQRKELDAAWNYGCIAADKNPQQEAVKVTITEEIPF